MRYGDRVRAAIPWVVATFLALALAATPRASAETGKRAATAEKPEHELPVPVMFGRVSPSVVIVAASLGSEGKQGSGVVIESGKVVTNAHVVSGMRAFEVRQGQRRWTATVEATDVKHDLAILQVASFDLPRVTTRLSSNLVVGERVFAIGAPHGLELTLSDGLVSALRHDMGGKGGKGGAGGSDVSGPAVIQISVPISHGSSGGGLFDAQGRLIGITSSGVEGSQNLNFALPVEWIEELRAPIGSPGTGVVGSFAQRPTPRFSLSQRPRTMRCRIDTRAMWAFFSAGAEMLESKAASLEIEIDRFGSQTPLFNGAFPGEPPYGELVLADMNREAGFIQFTSTDRSEGGSEYFFSLSDDDHFRLMMVRGVNFHGQPRARVSSGPCESVEPVATNRASFGERPEAGCRRGEIEGCVAAASAVEPQNKLSALTLYLRGCDLGSPGERAARRDAAAKSCREAARICDALGYGARAADLREKTRKLAGADSGE